MFHSALLNVMIKAARLAGRNLKRDFGEVEKLQVSLKGPANFVTAADRKAEQVVREELAKARPGYGFLGEEGGMVAGSDKTHTWIVDPLDGTSNFLHGIPQFAVSIALQRDDTIVAGLVYNPATDELFTAERGKGAFLNDQRLRVAARRRLADSVVGCGLPRPATSIPTWFALKLKSRICPPISARRTLSTSATRTSSACNTSSGFLADRPAATCWRCCAN